MRNMYNAASTMAELQQRINLTSNNLSNQNTHGYKARQSEFSSLLHQQVDNVLDYDQGSPRLTPDGIRVGSGARMGNINMNMETGSIQESGRALDVAIQDDNRFFVINGPAENGELEERYTRAGNFYLSEQENGDMMLTTNEGFPAIGEDGAVVLDGDFDDVSINQNGEVEVTRGGETAVEDTLELVDIPNSRILEPVDANSFAINADELGQPIEDVLADVAPEDANLYTKALETSNVDMGREMTQMLEAQRAYQFNARSLTIGDQMLSSISNMR
ncbi:flagellar basal-body rod protein FlgG [Alkalibacillus flavidus]|uniref:Flagellar basal-body rod protein FlgG n=1 Tax=Alkalibacillus flavidus TaxID=546021 RepID=A0ABV2KXC9_9BACI